MRRHLTDAPMLSLLLTLLAGSAGAADLATHTEMRAATALRSGIETDFADRSVRPQDDFFAFLNGRWLKSAEIPADKFSWGAFDKLHEDTQPQLRAIIEAAAQDHENANPDGKKIGNFYASFMDELRLETLGLKPLDAEIAKIAAIRNKNEIPGLIAHLGRIGIDMPYRINIHQDARDSTRYVADLAQSGLGMPDRDYYLKLNDPKLKVIRARYLAHIGKMLTLAGNKKAAASARQILGIETSLSKVQWTKVENRDPVKTYNKVELARLDQLVSGYDWKSYLSAAGVAGKTDYLIVSQPTYLTGFGKLLKSAPLSAWKSYLEWHLINGYAAYLSKAFVDQDFAFNSKVLSGQPEMRPRWKRGVSATEAALGESIGKLYVERHFPAERKARMDTLVKNLLGAFRQSIDTLDWMSPKTKKEAQDKLAKFTPKIGYPDKWRDYSALQVDKSDLVGNVMRANRFSYQKEIDKLGKPVDRDEWGMTPQTINAYYNAELNEIVFPAAILQPPFFDATADDAVNYGAIGAVIGHEISHGFDDEGAQYDGDGNMRDWWSKEDHKNFAARTQMLIEQYNAFSPLPGYHVNGKLTLGENIADNSGLAIAYKAYKLSLDGKQAPIIDGLTGEQRFFMGFGQVWRSKTRDEKTLAWLKTDPHSPDQFRTNGTLRNQPGFYQTFGVQEGDKMYLPASQRVTLW